MGIAKVEVRSLKVEEPAGGGGCGAMRLLTRQELAVALKVSLRTVDRMVADGEITPVILRGYRFRFYLPEVVRQLMARALVSKRGCARRMGGKETPRFKLQTPGKLQAPRFKPQMNTDGDGVRDTNFTNCHE